MKQMIEPRATYNLLRVAIFSCVAVASSGFGSYLEYLGYENKSHNNTYLIQEQFKANSFKRESVLTDTMIFQKKWNRIVTCYDSSLANNCLFSGAADTQIYREEELPWRGVMATYLISITSFPDGVDTSRQAYWPRDTVMVDNSDSTTTTYTHELSCTVDGRLFSNCFRANLKSPVRQVDFLLSKDVGVISSKQIGQLHNPEYFYSMTLFGITHLSVSPRTAKSIINKKSWLINGKSTSSRHRLDISQTLGEKLTR